MRRQDHVRRAQPADAGRDRGRARRRARWARSPPTTTTSSATSSPRRTWPACGPTSSTTGSTASKREAPARVRAHARAATSRSTATTGSATGPRVTDANGHTTSSVYDGLNRLDPHHERAGPGHDRRPTTTPRAPTSTSARSTTRPRGLRTHVHLRRPEPRDPAHGPLEGAGSAGEVYITATTYDDAAHTVTVTDPRGRRTTRRTLDGLDRAVEQVGRLAPAASTSSPASPTTAWATASRVVDPRGNARPCPGTTAWAASSRSRGRRRQARPRAYDGEGLKISETDRRDVVKRLHLRQPRPPALRPGPPGPSCPGVAWSQETRYLDHDRKRFEIDARGTQTDPRSGRPGPRGQGDRSHAGRYAASPAGTASTSGRRRTSAATPTLFDYDRINRLTLTRDPEPFQEQTLETTYADAAENKRTDRYSREQYERNQ